MSGIIAWAVITFGSIAAYGIVVGTSKKGDKP